MNYRLLLIFSAVMIASFFVTPSVFAAEEGNAFSIAVEKMKQTTPHAEAETEDYIITFFASEPKGWYLPSDDGLLWQAPGGRVHIEVVVRDKNDKRFVPNLSVLTRLYGSRGEELITTRMPFLWHPEMYHYGTNISVNPQDIYAAEVAIERPEFGRHDEVAGYRYESSQIARFIFKTDGSATVPDYSPTVPRYSPALPRFTPTLPEYSTVPRFSPVQEFSPITQEY